VGERCRRSEQDACQEFLRKLLDLDRGSRTETARSLPRNGEAGSPARSARRMPPSAGRTPLASWASGKLVPVVILAMLENPQTLWGDPCNPVVGAGA